MGIHKKNMFEKLKGVFKKEVKTVQTEGVDIQTKLDALIQGFGGYGINYEMAKDIFTEQSLTIHQQKLRCKKAYEGNSFVQVSVNYLLNIILGDKPGINSENESVTIYASRWAHFSGYSKEMKEALRQAIITGDGYLRKIEGSKGSYKYDNIENSEDIYIDWDYHQMHPKRFIERVYFTEAQAKNLKIKAYTLNTPYGTETIQGVEYSPNEIIHFKFLDNRWGLGYGRTPIESITNDVEIINQMERSIAVISKYKAVPKKLLMPDGTDSDGGSSVSSIMDQKEINQMQKQLSETSDYQSPILGKQIKAVNLTDGGQALDLTGYLDYFKRKISMVLSPEFIVHGELVNRATSKEQSQLFYLSVCSIRSEFIGEIDESVHDGLLASMKVLEDQDIQVPKASFHFEFGSYDVELVNDRMIRMMNEWNNGLIKLSEYRDSLEYPVDDEYGDLFKWETGAMTTPESSLEAIQKIVTKETKDEDLP